MIAKARRHLSEFLAKPPPHSPEAEQCLLGSILLKPSEIDSIASLSPEDFHDDANRILYSHLLGLHNDGSAIDITLLVSRLRMAGDFERIGGASYLARLSGVVSHVAHARHYADQIRIAANNRNRLQLLSDAAGVLADGDETEFAQTLRIGLDSIRPVDNNPVALCGIDSLNGVFADLEAGKGDELIRLPKLFDGFELGSGLITAIGAPPGTGKTAFASQVAFEALALNPGLKVYIANKETAFTTLLKRELTRRTGVSSKALRCGDLNSQQQRKVIDAGNDLAEFQGRLFEVAKRDCTLQGLRRLANECEPGLLIIDYLQKFAPRTKDKRQAVDEVVDVLRDLANEGWAILALSATARTQSKNGGHDHSKLDLSSFKESGEIEFNLDAGYILRDTTGSEGIVRTIQVDCVKNRHGELGRKIDLVFDPSRMSFEVQAPERFSEFDDYAEPAGVF